MSSPIRPEKFDSRPHVRIDHGLPENRKVADLSDAAFRLYIEAICFCSRTESNGHISDAQMRRLGPNKVVRELLDSDPDKPLVFKVAKGYEVRDYLQHQRSKDEITQLRSTRTTSGTLGSHTRWHVARRQFDPKCEHCQEERSA